MAQNKQALKGRIRSTKATMKITKAMQLIANAKLLKIRNQMEKNREYSEALLDMLHRILSSNEDLENPFLMPRELNRTLTIVFSSDLGLCGGYNSNMLRYALGFIKPDDPIMVIGSKGRSWLSNRGYKIINEYINSDDVDYKIGADLINRAVKMFVNNEIDKIQVIFTRFVNAMTFVPECKVLLPIEKTEGKGGQSQEFIYEPKLEEILDEIIPMTMQSVMYSTWLQTKTSEQGSRRIAMENATNNAEELQEQLVLQYNQARQAAITQEITEIVAGAGAL